MKKKRILLLGSTGSIGTQALDVVRMHPQDFEVVGLSCYGRIDELLAQIAEFRPLAVAVGTERSAQRVQKGHPELTVFYGSGGLCALAELDADILLNALMGISGLEPTLHAIETGKDIALANKETLVAGGALVTKLARQRAARLLPVDSEHSAIFQCLEGNRHSAVRRILLTASGGPFRGYRLDQLQAVSVEQALVHPRWDMGSKITIDSATMMNKGFEVIEARWLFDVPAERIAVHVHPESVVHSMVEFEDRSVLAQLGNPDMRIPIAYALGYPERLFMDSESLDLFALGALHFEKPDRAVFDCLNLAYAALAAGESYPVLLNAGDEALVALFLEGRIHFLDIQRILRRMLEEHRPVRVNSVEEILDVDRAARREAMRQARRQS